MITITNIKKVYEKNIFALNDVSLNIEQGEFVFVVGASGSGKSTLLKLILKEEEITSGNIFISGANITRIKKRELPYYRRKMGIVFQDFRLIDKMTVFENVAFAMRIVGANERSIRRRVPYVLSLVSLEGKSNRKPCELSGGEKQRVGLARAIVNNPKIIIADEPTGNIDPSMSYEIVELLANINLHGTTVIMVTHDLSVVEKFPFRIIELCSGKVRADSAGFIDYQSENITKVS
ncbi:MAG: cell division ATP-binding protein FtsE [Oscillospiraceae bacterium]|jgi:cell division transport system ATP-binding protein|nr:cell division ATP-binding protein FtsE [Oscillospiraceae bacterium]